MKYIFLRYPEGRAKALTLSYDDGAASDLRLLEILNRYGVKCTFNFCETQALTEAEIRTALLDRGHEIAVHGAAHRAPGLVSPAEGIADVLDCRRALEKKFGRIIRGMAYPDSGITRFENGGGYETVKQSLAALGIAYARTLNDDNNAFRLPEDWYAWTPTAKHTNARLTEWTREFLALNVDGLYRADRYPRLFYLWGHSFEFERDGNWSLAESFCAEVAGRTEIWYATNIEICEYVRAYRALVRSADGSLIHNPTATKLWFDADGDPYSVAPGETIRIS